MALVDELAVLQMHDMRNVQDPAPDWIQRHRRSWQSKPGLRHYYEDQIFARIVAHLEPGRVLQLGSGPGFFNRHVDNMVNLDFGHYCNVDVEADAHALPFADGTFANVTGVDVLHHLALPAQALAECSRVLAPGGRVTLIEPWAGSIGNIFYRYLHHEACADVEDVWSMSAPRMDKDPMDGNSKIPRIIFADQQERLRRSLPYLKIDRLDYFGCISYVLTGGFQRVGFPVGLIKSAIKAEKFLSQSTLRRIALRVLIVLHKTA